MDIITLAAAKAYTNKKIEEYGAGDVSSWNDLTDKPFGEEVVSLGDTISWDLTLTDTKIDVGGVYYQHVSNAIPAMEDLVGGTMVTSFGSTTNIQSGSILVFNDDIYAIALGSDPGIVVTAVENCTITFKGINIFIPKKGIYFFYASDKTGVFAVTEFKKEGYNFTETRIKPIDTKYLPEGIGYETGVDKDTLVWDGVVGNRHTIVDTIDWGGGATTEIHSCRIYDKAPPIELMKQGTMTVGDITLDFSTIDLAESNTGYGNPFLLTVVYDDYSANGTELKKGIYVPYDPESPQTVSLTIPNYFNFENIHKIDPKFLPEGIGYEETHTEEIVIEYDGDPTGKTAVLPPNADFWFVKVSDLTPEPSELIGAVVTADGQSKIITAADIEDGRPTGIPAVDIGRLYFVCYSPVAAYNVTETGMYVINLGQPVSLKYTSTVTNIHKIDPKYLPEHSWDDLEDKPFGEEFISVGDTLMWDGQPTQNYIEYEGMRVYQISSSAPSKDEWIGATISMSTEPEAITITEDYVSDMTDSVYAVAEAIFVVMSDDTVVEIDDGAYMTIPNKGIYGLNFSGFHMTSCHIQNYDFKKPIFKSIDPKYLPEGGFGYTELEKEMLPETVLSTSADFSAAYILPIDIELGKTYKVTVDGVSITGKANSSVSSSAKIHYVGNAALFNSDLPDTGEEFVLIKYFGFLDSVDICYIIHHDKEYPETITASVKRCDHVVQIDPKYLPTDGFGYEVVKHTGGNTLMWDGKPTDIAAYTRDQVVQGQTIHYGIYLVSSKTPTLDQISANGSTVGWTDVDGIQNYKQIMSNSITANDDNTGYKFADTELHFYVALEDNTTIGGTQFPKKGIYFECTLINGVPFAGVNSIKIPNFDFAETEIHKIDEKYLPDGTGTKIIDLTKYEANDGTNLNTALLLLFAAGGGSGDISCKTTFWEDVNTTKPIKLKIDASALVKGATIYSDATAMVCNEIGATFFSTTYAMYEPNSQAHIRATVMFERYVDAIRMSLILEPLTIPNNNAE